MANYDEVVNLLNSLIKVRIAPSKIHGVGVFAIRDIAIGQKMEIDRFPQLYNLPYSFVLKLFQEVRDILLERYPGITVGEKFIYPDCRFQAYMNHSDDPNYDNKTDTVLRNIKAGEEITENYRNLQGWMNVYKWLEKE